MAALYPAILLIVPCIVVAAGAGAKSRDGALDLQRPEDVIRAEMRLGCSPDPARPRISWMQGQLLARRAGEADRVVFLVQGINTRACASVDDARRGPGYRSVTREAIFYLDPQTRAPLERWSNPWTGESVPVVHVFNDPVNMAAPRHAYDLEGRPARWPGRQVNGFGLQERTSSFLRDSPLGGDYQEWVGGRYQVVESSVIVVPLAAWLGARPASPVPVVSSWTRISPWLPWMKMGGREGQTVLTATWTSAASIDELPEPLRGLLRSRHALYATAPPLDDARPSVNSWDGIKRALDSFGPGSGGENPAKTQ